MHIHAMPSCKENIFDDEYQSFTFHKELSASFGLAYIVDHSTGVPSCIL